MPNNIKLSIMIKLKAPLSIRIIYWFTVVLQVVLGLGILVTIVFNVLVHMGMADDLQLHVQFPVEVDFVEVGNLNIDNNDVKV